MEKNLLNSRQQNPKWTIFLLRNGNVSFATQPWALLKLSIWGKPQSFVCSDAQQNVLPIE